VNFKALERDDIAKNVCNKNLVTKPEGERSVERPKCRREYNIEKGT
jgi:hypothetical protein